MWQALYEELKDQNFEIISAAQDTGGEAAAGPWFDKEPLTYTCIVDETHKISTLFGFVNVPSAAWIDEEGRIVRINEGTYAGKHAIGTIKFGTEVYSAAVRDWVAKGADSEYVWTPEEVAAHLKPVTDETAKAEPLFKLGVYFQQQGNEAKATEYWEQAQALSPWNWNYHRQDWTFEGEQAAFGNWYKKTRNMGEQLYYDPLELPGEEIAQP